MTYDFSEFKSIVGANIMELNDAEGRLSYIGAYGLAGCLNLNSVILPSCTGASAGAFMGCRINSSWQFPVLSFLSNDGAAGGGLIPSYGPFAFARLFGGCSFPALKNIGAYAFYGATVEDFNFLENIVTIGSHAFESASFQMRSVSEFSFSSLQAIRDWGLNCYIQGSNNNVSLNFPALSSVGGGCFNIQVSVYGRANVFINCDILTSIPNTTPPVFSGSAIAGVSLAAIETLPQNCFGNCPSLASAYLPSLISVPSGCFRITYTTGNLTSIYAPNVEFIGDSAFGNTKLSEATFSKCNNVGMYAFSNCTLLESVYMPSCSKFSQGAFYNCLSLTSVYAPNVETIETNCFSSCVLLESAYFSMATVVGSNAFYNCSALSDVHMPNLSDLGEFAFYGCRELGEISLLSLSSIKQYTFYGCSALSSVSLPNITSVGMYAFSGCINLGMVSLPKCENISNFAFRNCTILSEIHIGTSNCVLGNSKAFQDTGITANTGKIYVPSDYVSWYRTAQNWSTFANIIEAEP